MKKLKLAIITILSLTLLLSLSSGLYAASYQQAPMLEKKVESGELPPVEERLPDNPFEVGPGTLIKEENLDWTSGEYGGTLTSAHHQPNWNGAVYIALTEPFLEAQGIGTDNVQGSYVEDYSVNEDNTEFIFHLREGLKWSDGHPVTTEDIRFTYEEVLKNENITPIFPANYRDPAGNPMDLEIIDDYTFKISFTEPYGDFITVMTIKHWSHYAQILKPKHYLKDFHINYTSLEEMEPYLEEEELDDEWWELFNVKDLVTPTDLMTPDAPGFPVLTPWVPVEAADGKMAFERNPYYHKVDTEGKQLPYIDRFESAETSDIEVLNMKVLAGEVDFLADNASMNKIPVYKEGEERGGYRTVLLKKHRTSGTFMLNNTYDDESWQNVINNPDFRRAVNMGIDRQDINESIYFGMASMPETVPSEYNPEKANEILDEIGMDERDENGFRLTPDGEEFEIFIETAPHRPDIVPTAELIVSHLKDNLDINASLKQISMSLHGQRATANELKATVLWVHSDTWTRGLWDDYLPFAYWANEWRNWYNTDGESGQEPPAEIKDLFDIHERILATVPYTEEGEQAYDDLIDYYQENIPMFITVENITDPLIVDNKLRNVPHDGLANEANLSLEQFYFQEEE